MTQREDTAVALSDHEDRIERLNKVFYIRWTSGPNYERAFLCVEDGDADMNSFAATSFGCANIFKAGMQVLATLPQPVPGVADHWYADSRLPVMATSVDAEDDRVLKLFFRRPVTEADRKGLIDALNAAIGPAAQASPDMVLVAEKLFNELRGRFMRDPDMVLPYQQRADMFEAIPAVVAYRAALTTQVPSAGGADIRHIKPEEERP